MCYVFPYCFQIGLKCFLRNVTTGFKKNPKNPKGSLDIDSIKQFSKMKWKKWNVSFVFFMLVTAKYATLHAELNKA